MYSRTIIIPHSLRMFLLLPHAVERQDEVSITRAQSVRLACPCSTNRPHSMKKLTYFCNAQAGVAVDTGNIDTWRWWWWRGRQGGVACTVTQVQVNIAVVVHPQRPSIVH